MIEEDLGLTLEQLFLEFDETPIAAASIGQVHRASLPERAARGREGAAARRPAAGRGRPRAPVPGREASRASACARSTSSTRSHSSTSSRARSGRSSTTGIEARNAEQFHRNFAGHPHVRVPRVYWTLLERARAHPRATSRASSSRDLDHAQLLDGRAPPPRVPHRRDLDGDDLPARVLPRRPAPGEHPRPRETATRSASSTSAWPESSCRRRHLEADRPLHRCRERERRGAPAAAARRSASVPEGARGGVRRRAPRHLLPVLRRAAERDRPDPAHPRGVRAHLPDAAQAADPLRPARPRDRDARLGRASSCIPTSTSSRWRSRMRASSCSSASRLAAWRCARSSEVRNYTRDAARAAVPDPRHSRAGPGRPDRGRLPPPGARRPHP